MNSEKLTSKEKTLGFIIFLVIIIVTLVGLFLEYSWWRGASIVVSVAGMAVIFFAFKILGGKS